MRLSVFGGTRGTGILLIRKAIQEGYDVTALARRPEVLRDKRFGKVKIVQGDVFDSDAVTKVVRGSDAVISTLGFVGRTKSTNIYSEGVLNVAREMQNIGPRRLIVLAASMGVDLHPDFSFFVSLMMKLFIVPMFGFAYRDMTKMTKSISDTELDWTLVGVPYLSNGKERHNYKVSIGKPLHHAFQIGRADVAQYLLSIINDKDTFRKWTEISW